MRERRRRQPAVLLQGMCRWFLPGLIDGCREWQWT